MQPIRSTILRSTTTSRTRATTTRPRNNNPLWFVTCFLLLLSSRSSTAGVLPLTFIKSNAVGDVVDATSHDHAHSNALLEYHHPNGTWLLSSSSSSPEDAHNLLLLKSILGAIKLATPLMPPPTTSDGTTPPSSTRLTFKIYGDGVEHKFPPFLERVIQRIQSYFSVYKYTDTSAARPVRQQQDDTITTTTTTTKTMTTTTRGVGEGTTIVEGSGDYTEFISIGENDGFISVGED